MDTRTKIVGWEEARRLAQAGATVVVGAFDPLVAAHARRLAEIAAAGGPVLVVLAAPADPILAAPARAELVAGLDAVAAVVIGTGQDRQLLASLPAARVIDEQEEDMRRRDALVRHIHARQDCR